MKRMCSKCRRIYIVDPIRRYRYMRGEAQLPKVCPTCRKKFLAFQGGGKTMLSESDQAILPEYIQIFWLKISLQSIFDFLELLMWLAVLWFCLNFGQIFDHSGM